MWKQYKKIMFGGDKTKNAASTERAAMDGSTAPHVIS
jgi:hypothetical protein